MEEWEKETADQTGLTKKEQRKMCLNLETLQGLRITSKINHTCTCTLSLFCHIIAFYSQVLHRTWASAFEDPQCRVLVE